MLKRGRQAMGQMLLQMLTASQLRLDRGVQNPLMQVCGEEVLQQTARGPACSALRLPRALGTLLHFMPSELDRVQGGFFSPL